MEDSFRWVWSKHDARFFVFDFCQYLFSGRGADRLPFFFLYFSIPIQIIFLQITSGLQLPLLDQFFDLV